VGPIHKELQTFTPKFICVKLSIIWVWYPVSEVRDTGVKKAPGPGSRIRIGNTGILELIVVISWTLGFPDTLELELSHKIEAAAASKTQLEASLEAMEARLHHSETEAKELRGQLDSVRLEAEAQRLALIDQLKQNHAEELAALVEQHEESKSQLMAQKEAHVQSHQDELGRLLSQVEELTRQVTRAQAERDTLQSQLHALAMSSEENAAERNAVEEDLRNQLTALAAQVAEATAKEGEVRQAFEDQLNSMVQAKEDQHQQQLALAVDQLETSRTVQSELESKCSEALRTVTHLEGQLASLGQEKASLEARLANYVEALADIKGMNEAVLGKARDSEKEAAKLRTFAAELVQKNAALEADIGVLRTEAAAAAEKEQAGASSAESQEQLKHLIQVGNGPKCCFFFLPKIL